MEVDTPRGPARVHIDPVSAPRGLLVLGHGAGGGVDAGDLLAVRDMVTEHGMSVARVEQPYRVAGRRAPAPAAHLDEAWVAVVRRLRADPEMSEPPLIVGGRSIGARVACRTARGLGAVGVVALAFPLHPPGRPERSRADELRAAPGIPVFVVNGDRDPFGMPEPAEGVTVHVVPGEGHGLGRNPRAAARLVTDFVVSLTVGSAPQPPEARA